MRDEVDCMSDPLRWEKIRAAWKEKEPKILERGCIDPYWFDWDMTPIERNVWTDIRSQGIPMYPQVPVGPFFLDFGDPVKRIGIEADGAAYHNVDRDRARDDRLWREHGWRIFRVTGAQTYRKKIDPWNSDEYFERDYDPDAWHRQLREWGRRDSEGVVWAISKLFYRPKEGMADIASDILSGLHLASFPVWAEA